MGTKLRGVRRALFGGPYWRIWKQMVSAEKRLSMQGNSPIRLPLALDLSTPAFGLSDLQVNWSGEIFRHLLGTQDGVFIDVGANVGQSLIQFLMVKPAECRYIGFEPNVSSFAFTQALIAHNKLPDCAVYPVGLSNENAFAQMHTLDSDTTHQSASIAGERNSGRFLQFVPTIRFDDAVESLNVDEIALIKIDVEHAELEVIDGMRETLRHRRPFVVCEVLPPSDKSRLEQLMAIVSEVGLIACRIVKKDDALHGLEPVEQFPTQDWSPENSNQHDYLFVPHEKQDSIQDLLIPQDGAEPPGD